MKSKQNDAQLIAEAYAKVEVQEEGLGAVAKEAGKLAAHALASDEEKEKEDKLETALAKGDIDEKDAREIKKHREEDAEHEGHDHDAPEAHTHEPVEVDMSQAPDPESLEVHPEPVADEVAVGNEERVNHHDDSEIKMALSELYKIEKYAFGLSLMLKELPALEGWTASKITKAADYLGSVFHKLDYDFASGEAPVHHEDSE